MIIGKSLTALGGGGLKPEIRVTAKAGALLNLHYKDSSIILQTYQLGAEETQHTFVVSVSETAYVVEDVTNDASIEVLVDAVAVFDVQMAYAFYLYKDGAQFETETGGWGIDTNYYNGGTFQRTDEYMRLYNNGTKNGLAIITGNTFDLTNYTKICFEYAINALSGCDVRLGLGNSYEWGLTSGYQASSSVSRKVDKFDITKRDKNYYATVKAWYAEVFIYKVWLE